VEGIPELIQHESTGLLVQPGDADALSLSLLRLAEDAALRLSLAEAGSAWALDACSADVMVKKTIDIYRYLIQGTPP